MKTVFFGAVLLFLGGAAWQIGSSLSSDALGMLLGVVFGIVAGLPAALLVMASGRRRDARDSEMAEARRANPYAAHGYPMGYGQPPVIVLAGNGMAGPQGYQDPYQGRPRMALPPPQDAVDVRQFKVVGEKEEWVDEW
jgi:hypothetical protein